MCNASMAFNFAAKKILVTGAGRGIGRAIAVSLAKSGGKVYALSRTKAPLDTLVQEHPDIVPIVQDLNDWDKTREKLEQLEPLDGLVNNAGIGGYLAPATDFLKGELDNYLQINLMGAINCCQVITKRMVEEKRPGSIVNVSSVVSKHAFSNCLGYAISKAGLDMVTKQFAMELGPHNIRVNSVNPTLVITDLAVKAMEKDDEGYYNIFPEKTAMARLPTVDDIVGPVLYLLSDCSAMVTGTSHFVDGGLFCFLTRNDKNKS